MVRVAADREQVRTARLSLIAALTAGAIALGVWLIMRDPPREVAPQRTLTTAAVEWVCDQNASHRFFVEGRFEPLPCRSPNCTGRCYIRLDFICLEHEKPFTAFVQFARTTGADGAGERVVEYRYSMSEPWISCSDGRVRCPLPGCDSATRRPHTIWSDISKLRPRRANRPDGQ
jgi:hypothetical protein